MNREGYNDPTAEHAIRKAGNVSKIKRFLYSIRSEQKEIEELQMRIEELTASLYPMAIRYDKDKVQVSPSDQMSTRMAAVADYANQLDHKVQRLMVRRAYAQKIIDQLQNSTERQVLDLYFLSTRRMQMQEIASIIGYEERQAWRYFDSALYHLNMSVNVSKYL